MFKGNPREPGARSFENIRFVLDEARMTRLRSTWEGNLTGPRDRDQCSSTEELNDEFIIAHLSSDSMTGLSHEIQVLRSMDILSIHDDGRITLAKGWEDRVTHMMLIEMKNMWGSKADTYNLYCIHDTIKLSLANHWKHNDDEGYWQRVFVKEDGGDDVEDDENEFAFDDEEFHLREQIFSENYYNWVSEKSGMGEFGV